MYKDNKKQNSTLQKDSFGLDKKSLRYFYKKQIESFSPYKKKQKETKITSFLNQLPFWKEASHIAAYKALKEEPCLNSFYESWQDKMCFPAIKENRLEFYQSTGQWKKNKFSILEPLKTEKKRIPLEAISVFLIPGLSFDRKGGRLGRGKAYYDQTLDLIGKKQNSFYNEEAGSLEIDSQQKKVYFIGVSFIEQIHNEDLPLKEHDILLDILVTDQFVLMPLEQKKMKKKNLKKSIEKKNISKGNL